MDMMRDDLKPCAISFSAQFDYAVRAEALRLLGSGVEIGLAPDDALNHPRLHDVLICLCYMAFGGIADFYDGDAESASWAVMREHLLCDQLANLESEMETLDGRTTLTAKADLKQREAEMRAAYQDDMDRAAARPVRQLPPGTRPSMTTLRGLAILRQREREE
jgi:hypothetical protein